MTCYVFEMQRKVGSKNKGRHLRNKKIVRKTAIIVQPIFSPERLIRNAGWWKMRR
jgi:hypothetical protein